MPHPRRSGFYGGVLFAGLFLTGAWAVGRRPFPAFPVFEKPVMAEFAAQDAGMVLNGSRRLGADLAFIQLLQYYGTAENADPDHARGHHGKTAPHPPDEHAGHDHLHMGAEAAADATNIPSRSFPQLVEYALRGGALDPRFHFLYLFSSGALAFNLNRGDEATELLDQGIRGDPSFWRYRLYQGGIAYRKNQEIDKTIATLEVAIRDPECPSMIKNILANIYLKNGNNRRAIEIFIDLMNSRDQDYVNVAKRQLRRFGLNPDFGN